MRRTFYKKVFPVLLILLCSSGCFLFNEKITPEEKKCMTLINSVGRIEELKYYINKGYYINCKYRGVTPLHIAAARGDLNTVKLLIDNNANVNINGHGSVLSWIIRNKNCYNDRSIKIMQLLLKHGADIKTKTSENKNLLHLFTIYDRYTKDPKCYRIGNFLVDKGVCINCRNNYGETPLHKFAATSPYMTKLLIDNGADVNVKNKKGLTPVFNTFYTLTNMKYLVQAGANVNAVTNDGLNVIHYAVLLNDIKSAEFLIQNGADPLFKTTKESIWILSGHPEQSIKTMKIPQNISPFMLAKLFGKREKMMELLKKYSK